MLDEQIHHPHRPRVLRVHLSDTEHAAVQRAALVHSTSMAELARASLRLAKVIPGGSGQVRPEGGSEQAAPRPRSTLGDTARVAGGLVVIDPTDDDHGDHDDHDVARV